MTQEEFNELNTRVSYSLELITADIAKEFLEHNIGNRSKKKKRLVDYTNDMLNGLWMYNGVDNIVFDTEGHLRNGQHRLQAIVKSGVSQAYIVVRGVTPDTFTSMDTGQPRNLADMLRAKEIPNDNKIAAVTTAYLQIRNGYEKTMAHKGSDCGGTLQQKFNFAVENEDKLQEITSVAYSYQNKNKDVYSPAELAGIIYHMVYDLDYPLTYITKFLYALFCGCTEKHDFINKFRGKCLDGKKDIRDKIDDIERYYGLIKCINSYFTGQQPKFAWSPKRDKYPKIIPFKDITIELDSL